MFKVLFFILLFLLSDPAKGQSYHYSEKYEADTAEYAAKMRELIKDETARYIANSVPYPRRNPNWQDYTDAAKFKRRSRGWDISCISNGQLDYYEHDTLRCTYNIPCYVLATEWKTVIIADTVKYKNGNLCTTGEFMVLSWFGSEYTFPVNRHLFYYRNGKVRSVATFNRYGVPICDSIFDKKGKFRTVKAINIKEGVPIR